ncbi:hypothetical protein [Dysgonomonas sp. 511]|uniref:hypothetical protein n=1 Tax=Dysgonomonas sp. 511 TaxID=2302930 RepID=UPI0013D348EA|nr:hypothetical protein [Dysgonomonas sp. 511]NDV79879.1 hypothetical protein [Dysgonomonas sp. 511]
MKPIEYLMDVLKLSRASVYRRLRSEIAFTYDEMIELSSHLNFPVEEIVPLDKDSKAVFSFQEYPDADPPRFFANVIERHYENLQRESQFKYRYAISVMNHIWLLYTIGYDNLLRFYYYKWLHHNAYITSPYTRFSDIMIPLPVLETSHKASALMPLLENSSFILDNNTFLNTIIEIQYYYRRKLINRDELFLLKSDMEKIINYTETQVQRGTSELGANKTYYISYFNIHSNSSYIENDRESKVYFYEYSIEPLSTFNPKVCASHKNWLNSIKKQSALITTSNQALQIDFFERQSEYLDCLMKDKDLTI